MKSFILTICLAALCGSALSLTVSGPCRSVEPISGFDYDAYIGNWYEIQRYENSFQAGGDCVVSEFYDDDLDNVWEMVHGMLILDPREYVAANGLAALSFPEESPVPGIMSISYTGEPTTPNYWVVDTDYENFSVVWSCSENGDGTSTELAWVLSRMPTLDESVEGNVAAALASASIDGAMRTTNQVPEDCRGEIGPY